MDALQDETVQKKFKIRSCGLHILEYGTASYWGRSIFSYGVILIFKYLLVNFD